MRMGIIRIMLMARPMSLLTLIWVTVDMATGAGAAGVAGTVHGIMVHGIAHTGHIPTGAVPIGAGAGEAGMAAGTTLGMTHGFMAVITDIMVAGMAVTMEAITVGIMVVTMVIIITGHTIPEIRADARRQPHTDEAAAVRIMHRRQEESADAVRRSLPHREAHLLLQTAVRQRALLDAVHR